MPNMTYEDYLELRGEKVDKEQLQIRTRYFIEQDRSFLGLPTIVYEGIFSHIERKNLFFYNLEYIVNPNNCSNSVLPSFFSVVDSRTTFYKQKYDSEEITKNVEKLVYTLTGKRSTNRHSTNKHMGIPEDAATIMALNLEDPYRISKTASNLSTKHKSKHSKGGKSKQSKRRTQRSRKH